MRAGAAEAALGAAAVLAFAVRSLGWREVLVGDRVVLPIGDAYYHARRALYGAEHWPSVLRFDPLVSYPDGSWVPWPPLHDWLLAAAGRLLGGGVAGVERAAVWLPPLLGALTVLPVFAAGRRLGGRAVGLGAAFLLALLPAHAFYTAIGNADHHCLVSLLGACWLAAALAAASPATETDPRARWRRSAALAAARLGVLLSFPGSLLHLAVADGAQVAALVLAGRPRALRAHAAGLAACALAVAPVIPWLGPTVGGAYSGIALSWLHVVAMAALAVGALACAALEARRPVATLAPRALRGAAVAAAVALAALWLPGLRDDLSGALGFVGKAEPWAALNAEQLPLWRPGAPGGWLEPLRHYGGFAFAIPLVPLAALAAGARDPRRRTASWVLAGWTAALGALAALQVRYGADYAPAAAVGFALLVAVLARALRGPLGAGGARLAAGLLAALAALPLVAGAAGSAAAALRAPAPLGDPLLATPAGSLYRFAEAVRAATPETAGFDDPGQRPAYSILAPPNIGHVLHWVARRATATDNFGPYAGSRHFHEARAFFWHRGGEREALALARRLGARYVITMEYGETAPDTLTARLHRGDGLAGGGRPRWRHFRLAAEGPAGGLPLSALFGARAEGVPYKLWEVVPGAVLEVAAPPGTRVDARLRLATATGRRFAYAAEAVAGSDGVARLRVPYGTDAADDVRALGRWSVRAGDAHHEVEVPLAAVRTGAAVAVPGAGA